MLTSLYFYNTLLFSGRNPAQPSDATVIIHQNTLNGFFNAIGPISGRDRYNVLGMHGDYVWTLRNARNRMRPESSAIRRRCRHHVWTALLCSASVGNVEVFFIPESNRISVKVLHASFEVYVKIFGKKIHITEHRRCK